MRRPRSIRRLLGGIAALALLAAACGGDDDDDGPATGQPEQTGGELILGAEQWPECLNPITQCSNAAWLTWTVLNFTLPKLMELDPEGNFVPSPVLDGDPVLSGEGTDNGDGPFTVTYTISEDAVWEDGSPITSSDVRWTWEARMGTTGVVTTTGYDQIANVDDSDPQVAVVEFSAPYADWQDIFGGATEFFMKEAPFEGRTDIADDMQTEIPFSGAPWVLESWSTEEAVLVPNENYWVEDRRPLVDRARFLPAESSEAEITAMAAGSIMAATPQPSPGLVDQFEAQGLEHSVGFGTQYEMLWFNQGSLLNPDSPLKDPVVREALLYAVDREAILAEIIHPEVPETEMLNCAAWVPTVGEWCADPGPFADIEYDPERVADLLEGDGWELGDDGIYVKDGQRLSITWQTVSGNQRREDIQALVIPAIRELGIELVPDNSDAGTLFEVRLPQMQTELGLYAQVTSPDPSATTLFACESIPTAANGFAGQNNTGWCNEAATDLMHESDQLAVPEERVPVIHEIDQMAREDAVLLPLYQLPIFVAWNPELVSGPIEEYAATPYQAFWNIYDWFVIQ
jgi:peptide/nickel transport system substrate-binding protein